MKSGQETNTGGPRKLRMLTGMNTTLSCIKHTCS